MVKSAHIKGKVSFRQGDGAHINIPLGPCEIEETAQDVTISWVDGETHGATAIPITDFKRYVATRAIVLLATQPA
ncbi:MAG: hypothetical protein H7Z15_05215 [Rhizobacter sp.]|nr:hypothetical protein [Rhizobacter sp.]